ncbi:UDP-N-acetylmuramoyl-L-alanine--D-glutamate ligase [Oricola cellulosilytica]|uniref:UDP-N-acetylmuramoylalanine--D-glutamate ligase n=1 Tax=Oricola cellulosilytica TaxID=1429082 RepID=A0A4R0PFQ5_9HYPH|nr:UDP-N-acetylmuramoyl-L-alanine--D-glutamate ligase [Oricola cellulosilytica]TCD15245.1 UDP-N-acetylmuramoyl-L-alanine--D-glutamate ligase [Oricola cellulosilytica]
MIPVSVGEGKHIALFGLGESGLATARALVAGGADVTCWDDNPESVAVAAREGLATRDLRELNWRMIDSLILAPGVPLTHPRPHWSVELAHAAGVETIGDIELFCRERRATCAVAPLIAITGTNGKSTTTALIAHILREAGRDVQLGGNIGTPILALDPPSPSRVHVIECSSYQIDLAPSLDPSIGVLLNLSPDHLDRHGTMENYAAIKARLLEGSDVAICGVDDSPSRAIGERLKANGRRVVTISIRDRGGPDLSEAPALRGDHNRQNALAAFAACRATGLSDEEIASGLRSFPGLAHRMQIIGRLGNTVFVNDSKATNADAADKSMASFEPIYWIAGGLPKEGGIAALAPRFNRVAKAYLIGEAAPYFAATLGDAVPYEISGTLDVAVRHAAHDAARSTAAEPVVLLAPAAASFDQFRNFEKRGEAFVNEVMALKGVENAFA